MKVFLHSITATGHLNSTIGIGQALLKNGHDVFFVIDTVLKEHLEEFGFIVKPLTTKDLSKKPSKNPAKDLAEWLKSNGVFSNKSSLEKFSLFCKDDEHSFFQNTKNDAIEHDEQIDAYICEEKPDVFICDHAFYYPCLAKNNVPWIRIISYQPISLLPEDNQFSPPCSGYSLEERDKFDEFRQMLKMTLGDTVRHSQAELNSARNFEPTGNEYFFNSLSILSPHLNIYQYPEELDYPEIQNNKTPNFAVDTFVREETNQTFHLEPEILATKPGQKLIYFSLGSMGGIDLELMQKLIGYLSRSPHKFIVSKGPLGDELELASNMWGRNSLPQTKVLPLVDLVITHGGNNTVCEAFYFGKPMIVMALFGDQYDNAQRIHEAGYGLRLEPYDVDEQELLQGIEALLWNTELHQRLQNVSQRIQENDKKAELCHRIEQAVRDAKLRKQHIIDSSFDIYSL